MRDYRGSQLSGGVFLGTTRRNSSFGFGGGLISGGGFEKKTNINMMEMEREIKVRTMATLVMSITLFSR